MADTKGSALTELTTFSGDETMYVIEDDDGTPASRRVTMENLVVGLGTSTAAMGTSFPGSPATGQRFFRTDRLLDYFYDGAQWLTMQLFTAVPANGTAFGSGFSASQVSGYIATWQTTYTPYLVELRGPTLVSTTNDGSRFWTVAVKKGSDDSTIGSYSTGTTPDTAGTVTSHSATINATTAEKYLYIHCVKTSTPGNLIVAPVILTYRLVG